MIMNVVELFIEHPIAHKRIVLCPPLTEKTFRNDRTVALYNETLARARPKPNDLLNRLVALVCVVIVLAPLAALLLYNANLQAGFIQP
jgi:hypothetical protein